VNFQHWEGAGADLKIHSTCHSPDSKNVYQKTKTASWFTENSTQGHHTILGNDSGGLEVSRDPSQVGTNRIHYFGIHCGAAGPLMDACVNYA